MQSCPTPLYPDGRDPHPRTGRPRLQAALAADGGADGRVVARLVASAVPCSGRAAT